MDLKYITFLIGEGRLDEVIDYLILNNQISSLNGSITSIKSRYSRLKSDINSGIISSEDGDLRYNKVVQSLIHLVENIRKEISFLNGGENSVVSAIIGKEFIRVDFSKFSSEYKDIYLSYSDFRTFQDLLNSLFPILQPNIPVLSYGTKWYILINDKPVLHLRGRMPETWSDNRSLIETGILPNQKIEIISKEYLASLFGNYLDKRFVQFFLLETESSIEIEASEMYSINHIHQELIIRNLLQKDLRYRYSYSDSNETISMKTKIGKLIEEQVIVITRIED